MLMSVFAVAPTCCCREPTSKPAACHASRLEPFGQPEALKGGGVKQVTVALAAHTPPLYEKLMAPQDGRGFGDVCAFVDACAQAGLLVECTAVEAPGVNKDATRKLAMSLGAAEFRVRSYHA